MYNMYEDAARRFTPEQPSHAGHSDPLILRWQLSIHSSRYTSKRYHPESLRGWWVVGHLRSLTSRLGKKGNKVTLELDEASTFHLRYIIFGDAYEPAYWYQTTSLRETFAARNFKACGHTTQTEHAPSPSSCLLLVLLLRI